MLKESFVWNNYFKCQEESFLAVTFVLLVNLTKWPSSWFSLERGGVYSVLEHFKTAVVVLPLSMKGCVCVCVCVCVW